MIITREDVSDPADPGPAVLQGLEILQQKTEAVGGGLHLVAGDGLALLLPRQHQVHLQDGAAHKQQDIMWPSYLATPQIHQFSYRISQKRFKIMNI
jgi:hypothetical protein